MGYWNMTAYEEPARCTSKGLDGLCCWELLQGSFCPGWANHYIVTYGGDVQVYDNRR